MKQKPRTAGRPGLVKSHTMTTPHPAADGRGWQDTMSIAARDANIMVLVAVC